MQCSVLPTIEEFTCSIRFARAEIPYEVHLAPGRWNRLYGAPQVKEAMGFFDRDSF